MVDVDCIAHETVATDEEISQVASRVEYLLNTLVAMHDLCTEKIANPTEDSTGTFVLLRELLRSAARDAENCAEVLRGTPGDLGCFEGHFGRI